MKGIFAVMLVTGLILAGFAGCLGEKKQEMPPGQERGMGWIYGSVKNETGIGLPDVEITVTGGNITNTTKSGSDGGYTVLNLVAGVYALKASLQGYDTFVKENCTVEKDKGTRVDITLIKSLFPPVNASELKILINEDDVITYGVQGVATSAVRTEKQAGGMWSVSPWEDSKVIVIILSWTPTPECSELALKYVPPGAGGYSIAAPKNTSENLKYYVFKVGKSTGTWSFGPVPTATGGDTMGAGVVTNMNYHITIEMDGTSPEMAGRKVEKFEEEGSIPAPSAGEVGVRGVTYVNFVFPVKEGAELIKVQVICTNKETQARADFDLYVYDKNGEQAGSSATKSPDESCTIQKKGIVKGGYGDWTAWIDNFSGVNAAYKITVEVYYPEVT